MAQNAGAPYEPANKWAADFMKKAFKVGTSQLKEYKEIMEIND